MHKQLLQTIPVKELTFYRHKLGRNGSVTLMTVLSQCILVSTHGTVILTGELDSIGEDGPSGCWPGFIPAVKTWFSKLEVSFSSSI